MRPRSSARRATAASLRASLGLPDSKVAEHLHPAVVRVGHEDAVLAVNEHSRGKLEFAGPGPLLPEVIEQASLLVEDLHVAVERLGDIDVALGIHRHAFGAEELAA